MASTEPIHIGAGYSVSEGYRPDLFQDVPDQGHHMLAGMAHVTVHFAIPVPISLSASPSPLRIEKLENGLWEAVAAKLHEIFPERDAKDFHCRRT